MRHDDCPAGDTGCACEIRKERDALKLQLDEALKAIRAIAPYCKVKYGMDEKVVDEIERLSGCTHDWRDARNEVVVSGEFCIKCNAIRAGNATTDLKRINVAPDGPTQFWHGGATPDVTSAEGCAEKRIEPAQKCSSCGKASKDVDLYCATCYHDV